jgi:cell division protein FtsB
VFNITDKFHQFLHRLSDLRFFGQVVFVAIVLLVSYSGVKVIHTNYKLQQHIAQVQQEIELQKLKNANQKLKNEYYNTDQYLEHQYLELAARQNFGLAASGEKELLVPKAVALAHVPEEIKSGTEQGTATAVKQPFYAHNLQAWTDFFLHRTPTP